MKTKLLSSLRARRRYALAAIFVLLSPVLAHAHLIDLTPGGFNTDNGFPPQFIQFLKMEVRHAFTFFDEATPNCWVSRYGILPGGTYFSTDLIGQHTPTANVSWNFSALPGWSMSRLLVFGRDENGKAWDNLYGVATGFKLSDSGDVVTLHGDEEIFSIAFYGRTPRSPVPDSGSTLLLFALFPLASCAVGAYRARGGILLRRCV